jgi:hypothetical protein
MAATGNGSAAGSAFIRPHLLKLAAYTPIEPFEILSAKLGRKPQDIVKLDANENPYGPPPEVLQALGSMQFPNIYPDPESRRLREALAKWHDVPMEHLLVSMWRPSAGAPPCAGSCASWHCGVPVPSTGQVPLGLPVCTLARPNAQYLGHAGGLRRR